MSVDVAWGQLQGGHEVQQDRAACLGWENGSHLMLLADGVGGCTGGEVASDVAVDCFRASFVNSPDLPPRQRLLSALQEANYAIFDRVEAEPSLGGMGTTLVAAAAAGDQLHWVSVGDSPLWLFRQGKIRRLNENHSVGGALDRQATAGEISAAEAAAAPGRNELLAAVTGFDINLVDAPLEPLTLQRGDTIVLASDGIETCGNDELVSVVSSDGQSSSDLVESVLEAVEAHNRPHQDNATLIVYRLQQIESKEEE